MSSTDALLDSQPEAAEDKEQDFDDKDDDLDDLVELHAPEDSEAAVDESAAESKKKAPVWKKPEKKKKAAKKPSSGGGKQKQKQKTKLKPAADGAQAESAQVRPRIASRIHIISILFHFHSLLHSPVTADSHFSSLSNRFQEKASEPSKANGRLPQSKRRNAVSAARSALSCRLPCFRFVCFGKYLLLFFW